ncbi:hypothetical protein PAXRUDRAFT_156138 [Paxillus rubicundulus Ve08.2h10]|uniref:DEAD/DEAH-box helicase domain-containing protein n=1 Tax=Paxillus rubicundulus Ve08.2h10 TaxID=930991 RepID=A0A0D0CFG7_9AGAM|nr:hypothetical protein PAXRUDRAFT_156138 [Paxillus rubicundulus Ve08.2h10]
MLGQSPLILTFAHMRAVVEEKFSLRPCDWKLLSVQHQLKQKDVFTVSPTGLGKTLTFWIPLLFNHDGIIIIVTPLNITGEKNCNEAILHGFPAIHLCAKTATDQTFKVCDTGSTFATCPF